MHNTQRELTSFHMYYRQMPISLGLEDEFSYETEDLLYMQIL